MSILYSVDAIRNSNCGLDVQTSLESIHEKWRFDFPHYYFAKRLNIYIALYCSFALQNVAIKITITQKNYLPSKFHYRNIFKDSSHTDIIQKRYSQATHLLLILAVDEDLLVGPFPICDDKSRASEGFL